MSRYLKKREFAEFTFFLCLIQVNFVTKRVGIDNGLLYLESVQKITHYGKRKQRNQSSGY